VRIAWVTHRNFDDSGGSEIADKLMVSRRPTGIEITHIRPGGVAEDIAEFDRVVVTGLYGYSNHELNLIAACEPVIWSHDLQFVGHWLYERASIFLALNQMHLEWEMEKANLKRIRCELNPGWMDTSFVEQLSDTPRTPQTVLWAHRDIWHKGLEAAKTYCEEHDLILSVLIGEPRDLALQLMAGHQYFILLSQIRDAGPLSVMEAQMLGCELILENVGYWPDAEQLRFVVDNADKRFWGLVCESV